MNAMTADEIAQIAQRHYGLAGALVPLDSEWGGTFRLTGDGAAHYLIKIAPSHVNQARTRMEIAALEHLADSSCEFAYPMLVETITGERSLQTALGIARVHKWVDGRLWSDVNPKREQLRKSLGEQLGSLKHALNQFEHPAAHDQFDWSPHELPWIGAHMDDVAPELQPILAEILSEFEALTPTLNTLPKTLNYNDANDNNVIVSLDPTDPKVIGFIDFGDMNYGPRINDLAIALAYNISEQDDPIGAACDIIAGYKNTFPLEEAELAVLLILTKARLAISLVKAALRGKEDPDNQYWQINTSSSYRLIKQLHEYRNHLALCRFRHAAGYEPSPTASRLRAWLKSNFEKMHPVTGIDLSKEKVEVFDWSVANIEMGGFDDIANVEEGTRNTFATMHANGVRVGIGRYNEPRAVYTTDEYLVPGNNGPEMRTIHTGIDIFMEALTPLYAPLDGTVHVVVNDAGDKEYGPLVILEHTVEGDLTFYTLYGHNSLTTLELLRPGQQVAKGDLIGYIGDYPENGNWVPHSHFQIITNMLGYKDDFPGVALASQRDIWLSISPDPNLMLGIQDDRMQYKDEGVMHLLEHRQRALGPNLSVSHKTPLHVVRGWKTRLYTANGTGYLDTRNNIAHVGHEHPAVVRAGQKQMAVLNTNTRYLHKTRLELADKLLATLPDNLSRIYFVNAGSEANDLALRMASTFTGSQETLVMDNGYHGHTRLCVEVSHYKFASTGGPGQQAHVHVLPAISRNSATVTKDALAALHRANPTGEPITFIHEALPSCAGQIVPPEDYFTELYRAIRESSGCCIADEVQTGIGRVGKKFWAFELFDIQPDIVTIGKPLGNGHPIAAVATSEAVAEAFDTGMEFFSSFGGNPVSCAIGTAVLEVVQSRGLQEHAKELGEYWSKAFKRLQQDYGIIADVRGSGLFLGVEFAHPDDSPATARCRYIESRLFDHKILSSFDGPGENVLKIKPPMSITKGEVNYFVQVLAKILREDFVTYD